MKRVQAYIDYTKVPPAGHVLMFTANSTIKKDGTLVMGAGNALAANLAVAGACIEFGKLIEDQSIFLCVDIPYGEGRLAAFQTKVHWRDSTPISLLQRSIEKLHDVAITNQGITFHLPMAGVNNGGLCRSTVVPMLQILPDNVIVYG